MLRCVTNKRVYETQTLAEDALIEVHRRSGYPVNQGPIAVYKCDDCGYYHLTSKGILNEKLAQYLNSGKAKLDREANRWQDKFKKK